MRIGRRLLALLPAALIVWFLSETSWYTFGYLLGDAVQPVFTACIFVFGLGPLLPAAFARFFPDALRARLTAYSNYHLIALMLLFAAAAIVSLLSWLLGIIAPQLVLSYVWLRPVFAAVTVLICFLLCLRFNWAASHPVLTSVEVPIAKPGPKEGLRIHAVSDIHWETLKDKRAVQRAVDIIAARSSDAFLILGDSVTASSREFIEEGAAKLLASVPTRYGIYAVTGNHDFYVEDIEQLIAAYRREGVTVLRDQVCCLADALWLVGREDRGGMRGLQSRQRMPLTELLQQVDEKQAVLVLDHQPRDLAMNAELGIDLELCGHTHGGQLWPIIYITERMYELNYGLKRIGSSHFFVTSGLGYWGPPLRIGTKCEVLEINLQFQNALSF